ncbi:MAG: hypothetical protein MJE77_07450 [Proteobacteria bacterium]|nr:hypothetical protein [Pseudomonadota bacterium]
MADSRILPCILTVLWAFSCNAKIGDVANDTGPLPDASVAQADSSAVGIALPYTPSNIAASAMSSGTAPLQLRASDGAVEIDTDQGTITRLADSEDLRPPGVVFASQVQGSGGINLAPLLGIFSASELVIEAGARVTVKGSAGLVFAIAGDVKVDGVVSAVGGLDTPNQAGPGGFAGGDPTTPNGGGLGGGQPGTDGAGGGGAGHVALGGKGGDRGELILGGAAGQPVLSEFLVPLMGGSGGGLGSSDDNPDESGLGGGGGGVVQISALGSIRIGATGGINCGGGGGQGGVRESGGGGAGAGGAILLEAMEIAVFGILAANGGGGGGGANGNDPGASGQTGSLSAVAAPAGKRVGDGAAGGLGGAGGDEEGLPGVDADIANAGTKYAGGGGGSGGRIHLRSVDDGIKVDGIASPKDGVTEGTLVDDD